MTKILKYLFYSFVGAFLSITLFIGVFIYKAKRGINFYHTDPIELPLNLGEKSILVFSKANGFRHSEAIEASLPTYEQMAHKNGWKIFMTEDAGVFNELQLALFQVVIWNNTSGKVLTDNQRTIFKKWIEDGGGFIGVHAAGDDSHQWAWYEDEVLQAHFSHHNIGQDLDTATLYLDTEAAKHRLSEGLLDTFDLADEWYCFYDNPRAQTSSVLYTVDEATYDLSGNISFLVKDKNWGMGQDHPIVWYHEQKEGKVFYTALGHSPTTFRHQNFQQLLTNAIRWTGNF